jgi:16S rRNA (uracil1498-N3)-methyltransferase
LRLRQGDKAELFDGKGAVAEAVVAAADRGKVVLEVLSRCCLAARQQGRVIIAAGVAKGWRFDWLVEKCTELGVEHIVPVLFSRTVKQPAGSTAAERWRLVAVEACKQSGRVFVPQVDAPATLRQCAKGLKARYPSAMRLIGSCDASAGAVGAIGYDGRDCAAFVGPEGGLTGEESELLVGLGAMPVSLTATVLRTETAAVAFAAVLCAARDASERR